jgi:26S proteasome regulatory subunit N7
MADSSTAPKIKPKKKLGQPSAGEETASPFPDMELCQQIHRLTTESPRDAALEPQIFEQIAVEMENPSLYRKLRKTLYPEGTVPSVAAAKLSEADLVAMEEKHQKHLEELEAKVEEAKESAGDMEVMEARVAIARFAAKSLSEKQTIEAYQKLLDLPKVSSGKKIDALMESARVASFYGDTSKADDLIDRADKMANDGGGGDWDRRNRLKVYRALQKLLHRDMEAASALLLDCIATFSCSEVCSYKDFIVYTALTNILHLPRPQLKTKVIDGPEILSVAEDIPVVVSSLLLLLLLLDVDQIKNHGIVSGYWIVYFLELTFSLSRSFSCLTTMTAHVGSFLVRL